MFQNKIYIEAGKNMGPAKPAKFQAQTFTTST